MTDTPTPRPLARWAHETTAENPWPLHLLTTKIDDYVNKMSEVWVEGQIVQFNRRPGSGVQFMTVRDADADSSMTVTIFSRLLESIERSSGLRCEAGMRVVIHAKPRFWPKRGSLALAADDIRAVGMGDLLAQIERLRRILAAEGLFEPSRKRPLPFFPRTVGLICGRNSKAEQDVLVNARLRWPDQPFEVREVAVQGDRAVTEVIQALQELDARSGVDVIVIARGGGAVEDLLPFSDEALVRAAAAAQTPIVSAIGHETDCPLLDLVADYRASTPTDAARRIVPDLRDELMGLDSARERMRQLLTARIDRESTGLEALRSRPVMAQPRVMVDAHARELGEALARVRRATLVAIDRDEERLRTVRSSLSALSPLGVLERGYAIVRTPGRGVVRDSATLSKGDLIEGIFAQGRMVAQVVGTTSASAHSMKE